jgi:hypothetical protein
MYTVTLWVLTERRSQVASVCFSHHKVVSLSSATPIALTAVAPAVCFSHHTVVSLSSATPIALTAVAPAVSALAVVALA